MVDVAKVIVESGKGGNGSFSFRREKYVPKGGPDGGDGGDGGDVYLVATSAKQTLRDFAGHPKFKAQDGGQGGGRQKSGQKGRDIKVEVPLGTVVWELDEIGEKTRLGEIVSPGDRLLVAKGGFGGRGNIHFKNSTNRTPLEYEEGGEGEQKTLLLELKLIADIGLVGLPNAGKSTLLSVVTRAQPKIADYPFTTLEPNLGVMELDFGEATQRYIMADIPGLIEQASQGKGLGHRFLRHIERSRVLLYLLYVPEENLADTAEEQVKILYDQYQTLVNELETYDPSLLERPHLVAINKSDLLSVEFAQVLAKNWPAKSEQTAPTPTSRTPYLMSAATQAGLAEVKQALHEEVQKVPKPVETEEAKLSGVPVFSLPDEKHQPKLAYRPPLKKG